jgi:hypothetical protein
MSAARPEPGDPEPGHLQRGRRWPWDTAAIVTLLVLALPVAGLAARKADARSRVSSVTYHRPVANLELSGAAGFTVSAGPPGQVRVVRRLSWDGTEPAVRPSWAGRTLTISAACTPPGAGPPWWRLGGTSCDLQVDIQIPPGVAVRAAVGAGAVTVARVTGSLHLQVTSGSIAVTGGLGPVWARAQSGQIRGTDLAARQVQATVTSGAVSLQFAQAPDRIVAAASSGSVAIWVPPGQRYRLAGAAGPGSRTIARGLADSRAGPQIDVTVGSGDATVGYER